jgi:hypothetical protein
MHGNAIAYTLLASLDLLESYRLAILEERSFSTNDIHERVFACAHRKVNGRLLDAQT